MDVKSAKDLHSDRVQCLIYGQAGVGKTSMLGTLDESTTLIISAEAGLLSISDKNTDVLEINHYGEIAANWSDLRGSDYKTICIDSLTEISDMLLSSLEADPYFGDKKNALPMWGEYSKRITKLIKAFRTLDKNIVFTALVDDVQDGGILIKAPMIKGKAAQKTLSALFDELFYMSYDNDGGRIVHTTGANDYQAKDRSGKLDALEQPNLNDIFNKIKGTK